MRSPSLIFGQQIQRCALCSIEYDLVVLRGRLVLVACAPS